MILPHRESLVLYKLHIFLFYIQAGLLYIDKSIVFLGTSHYSAMHLAVGSYSLQTKAAGATCMSCYFEFLEDSSIFNFMVLLPLVPKAYKVR